MSEVLSAMLMPPLLVLFALIALALYVADHMFNQSAQHTLIALAVILVVIAGWLALGGGFAVR